MRRSTFDHECMCRRCGYSCRIGYIGILLQGPQCPWCHLEMRPFREFYPALFPPEKTRATRVRARP